MKFKTFPFAIDPETLQIEQEGHHDKAYQHAANKHTKYATYKTNWKKLWSANAFTACGVLYTLQKFDTKKTTLNYVYVGRVLSNF